MLKAMSLSTVGASIMHNVEAIEASVFVLTISWPAYQQLLAAQHRGYGTSLLTLCVYGGELQASRKCSPFSKGRPSWHLTAQRPFEAYDQTIRKIFCFLAFSCPCFAPDEHLSSKQQDSGRPYEPRAQI
jgi:hypothetical protein